MGNLYRHKIIINEEETLINITPFIKEDIKKSNIKNGLIVVYCPHTTAAIAINENADYCVINDLLYGLESIFPQDDENYMNFKDSSSAHLKALTLGASTTLILYNGQPILGTWQYVYFCEFQGPKERTFYVKIFEDK